MFKELQKISPQQKLHCLRVKSSLSTYNNFDDFSFYVRYYNTSHFSHIAMIKNIKYFLFLLTTFLSSYFHLITVSNYFIKYTSKSVLRKLV